MNKNDGLNKVNSLKHKSDGENTNELNSSLILFLLDWWVMYFSVLAFYHIKVHLIKIFVLLLAKDWQKLLTERNIPFTRSLNVTEYLN